MHDQMNQDLILIGKDNIYNKSKTSYIAAEKFTLAL